MLKDYWIFIFVGNYNVEIRLNNDIYNNVVYKNI